MKSKLSLLLLCSLVIILSACSDKENKLNANQGSSQNTVEEQRQVSNPGFEVEYETILYRKISKNFQWQWSIVETIPGNLETIIEEHKNAEGAFIVDSNEKEYTILINTGLKPSSDYGFEIKRISIVKEGTNNKEALAVINTIKTNDKDRFNTQQIDTMTIGIVKIDKIKLPKDIILNGVSIVLAN